MVLTQDDEKRMEDYAIWDMLSERVYAGQQHQFAEPELKQKTWKPVMQEISLTEIRASISCWKKDLKRVIDQDGSRIELLL